MNLSEAKEWMKQHRRTIEDMKRERMHITEMINEKKNQIREIKGKIFMGEITA